MVAGRQDLQQIAAGDLLLGSAGRSHEGLVDPGDRCRLARRDLAARERRRDRIHRSRHVLRRRFVNLAVADGREGRQRERDRAFMAPRQHPFDAQLRTETEKSAAIARLFRAVNGHTGYRCQTGARQSVAGQRSLPHVYSHLIDRRR
jgi:hypothetical protein